MKRNSIFGQKPWIIPLENFYFLAPFKTLIFLSKIILFYQEYEKMVFPDLITPKNPK